MAHVVRGGNEPRSVVARVVLMRAAAASTAVPVSPLRLLGDHRTAMPTGYCDKASRHIMAECRDIGTLPTAGHDGRVDNPTIADHTSVE
jgi:hypothetical protein